MNQIAEMAQTQAQPMPEQTGVMDGIYNFLRRHPLAAKLAVGVGMLGVGATAEMAIPTAAEATSHSWTVLGGDPLVPGGVHSRAGLTHLLNSSKGEHVLKGEGFNGTEVNAIQKAARNNQETSCTLNDGDHFKSMAFGQFGEVENDVTYYGHSAPAYCLDVKVKEGNVIKNIDLKIPQKCANIAVAKVAERKIVKHKPHKRTAPVEVIKIAEDAQKHVLPATPTGVFEFDVTCKQGRNTIEREVIYNHTPQRLVRCNIGSVVTVTEMPTLGPDTWDMLTPATQKMKVHAGKHRNRFVFKDKEVLAVPTPQPTPPTVTPKNGAEGPGVGTPGQPGGPGAGGQPGNTGEGAPCYDDNSTTNGDLNPATSGDILYGTPDQFGNCVGSAQPMQNA